MEVSDLGSGSGPEHARERLAQWQGQLDRMVTDAQVMHDRIHGMRVTLSDRNRLVSVTVDYTGALVDLDLSERMRRTAPRVVADTILATIGVAKAQVAEEADEIIAETLGTRAGDPGRDSAAVGPDPAVAARAGRSSAVTNRQ